MLTRRRFGTTAAAAVVGVPFAQIVAHGQEKKKDKVRVALIGIGGQGLYTLNNIKNEELVAICDIDEKRDDVIKARKEFPDVKFYTDYRKMLGEIHQKIDAVAVCTPDHTHAHATLSALTLKKHVYCEKPLCRTVEEVRDVMKLAAKNKAITQMGTQIHSGENYRRVVEIVKSGVLGKIKSVKVWCSRRPDAGRLLVPKKKVEFDLDAWLGPVSDEFFYANHMKWPHFHWRWWWAFGGGVLGDMGCHFMDLAFWALDLGHPTTVKATGTEIPNADNTVPQTLQVDYLFPANKTRAAIPLTWYHGVAGPDLSGKERYTGFGDGVLFEGEDGKKLVANYSKYQLFPEAFAKDFKAPEKSIGKSVGHHAEWLNAIRGDGTPLCHFGYSGPLTQAVLLGNVSYRAGGIALGWDEAKGETDSKAANEFLKANARTGFKIPV